MTISATVSSPTSSARRRSSCGWSSLSWVAQAVESARMTSTASSKVSMTQWSASWSPTISRHRPTTPPMLTGALQPRSARSRSTIGPRGCGSRRDGPAPLPTFPRPGPGRKRRFPAGGRPGAVRRSPLAAAAARARARAWRAASAGSSVPSAPAPSGPPGSGRFFWGSVGRSATGDLPSGDGEPGSGELGRHVVRDGGGDEDLLGARDHGGQSLPATDVELGEDVVEDEDGAAVVVLLEHLERGEAQG